jgi:hypothetical protein
MPYGAPSAGDRSYTATVRSVALVGGHPVIIHCTLNTEAINDAGLEPVFQAFVDAIEDSAQFVVVSASREQSFRERVTRTPRQGGGG